MAGLTKRDIAYQDQGSQLLGYFCCPEAVAGKTMPGVVMVHGAHGLNGQVMACAERLAAEGFAVLAADLWGERKQLSDPAEIGPMLGRFGSDPVFWKGRLAAAQDALANQPEVTASLVAMVGYCFGGASALEYVRQGGPVRAAVSLHGAFDLIGKDWSSATPGAQVLIATGNDDPLAKAEDLRSIEEGLSDAGVVWDTVIYGGVKHAFTEPDQAGRPPFAAYDARADRRSFAAMTGLLAEALTL